MKLDTTPLYLKAAAIAIKLGQLQTDETFRPEFILRNATAEEIDFYYAYMCGAVKI